MDTAEAERRVQVQGGPLPPLRRGHHRGRHLLQRADLPPRLLHLHGGHQSH